MRKTLYLLLFFFSLSHLLIAEENRVILVTGGAGYIGSHTCKMLKDAGYTPVSYDSLINGSKESVKWGPLVIGDLLDQDKLDSVFAQYHPIAVIHFAGLLRVGESVQDPSNYYMTNVAGSLNLLNAMLKHEVKTIVFSSSCTVYGSCDSNAINETVAKAPVNPYARSKFAVEKMIEDFSNAYDFKYVILRYFNAAGIDKESGLRRSPRSQCFLVPMILLSILQSDTPLKIFGTDYPTLDGTAVRDYIHVKDLARAHLLSLNYLQEGKPNEAFNLGTGRGYSVLEVVQKVEEVTQQKVPYVLMPRREGDVAQTIADPRKAMEILQFKPLFSDLETIIESEWQSLYD